MCGGGLGPAGGEPCIADTDDGDLSIIDPGRQLNVHGEAGGCNIVGGSADLAVCRKRAAQIRPICS